MTLLDAENLNGEMNIKAIKLLFKLLEEEKNDISEQIIKCIPPLVLRLDSENMQTLFSMCAGMLINEPNDKLRERYYNTLKTLYSKIPLEVQNRAFEDNQTEEGLQYSLMGIDNIYKEINEFFSKKKLEF